MKGSQPQSPLRFPWWEAVIGLAAIACTFIVLQLSTGAICCGDLDGYYHIHWSRLLWEGLRHGHLPEFSWLPLTSLNAHDYADQHFLFHLLPIPLLWFTNPVSAGKIAAAVRDHGGVCLLLVGAALSHEVLANLASRSARILIGLLVPDEHDTGAKPLTDLHHDRNCSSF